MPENIVTNRDRAMKAGLISIIGPPAVGKTTLAEHLAEELPARLIREDYEGNPFLAESYRGDRSARLPAQLHYLLSRVAQLWPLTCGGGGPAVSDYGFCQDRLFARLRLNDEEFSAYERVADPVGPMVPPPRVVVHLDASVGTLLGRIRRRGRRFESAMTAEFVSSLRGAYSRIAGELACGVLVVDCDCCDLLDASLRSDLARRICAHLAPAEAPAAPLACHERAHRVEWRCQE